MLSATQALSSPWKLSSSGSCLKTNGKRQDQQRRETACALSPAQDAHLRLLGRNSPQGKAKLEVGGLCEYLDAAIKE